MMRSAISPRLAIRTFEMAMLRSDLHREKLLAILDRLSVLRIDLDERPFDVRLDLVHQLHRFDDAENLRARDVIADIHEDLGLGIRLPVERADDRRRDDVQS